MSESETPRTDEELIKTPRTGVDTIEAQFVRQLERELTAARAELANYEEVLADHRRLFRELDVAMFGIEGAAKQASLCDLINPARKMREQRDRLRWLITQVYEDLPKNRDWLNPDYEREMKDWLSQYLESKALQSLTPTEQ